MRSRLSLIAFLFVASSLLTAQATYRLPTGGNSDFAATQRRVVGLYCRLDFDGNRFTQDGWQKMQPLMQDRRNPDFQSIEIISRYQIEPPSSQFRSLDINVIYYVLGRFDTNYGYVAAPSTSSVNFRVEDKTGDIVITSIQPPTPRVSKRAAVQWLKSRLTSVQDPVEKGNIERALKTLEPPATPAGVPAVQPAEASKTETKTETK